MKVFDYIIVGQGIAGTVLAFQLRLQGKRVFVIDKHRDYTSSKIAPGTYNPMVLKRFTPCWKVEDQLTPLYDFLDALKHHLILHSCTPKIMEKVCVYSGTKFMA